MIRRLAPLLLTASALLAACSGAKSVPITASTAAPAATVAITSATATASATGTPRLSATPTATAPAGATPPVGYAGSCAAGRPWDVLGSDPFVCIDSPTAGKHVARGIPLVVQGYAGGSFENNVVVDVYRILTDGTLDSKPILQTATTARTAGGFGPGRWELTLNTPSTPRPLPVRISAHFGSPRGLPEDTVTVEASITVVLD